MNLVYIKFILHVQNYYLLRYEPYFTWKKNQRTCFCCSRNYLCSSVVCDVIGVKYIAKRQSVIKRSSDATKLLISFFSAKYNYVFN